MYGADEDCHDGDYVRDEEDEDVVTEYAKRKCWGQLAKRVKNVLITYMWS